MMNTYSVVFIKEDCKSECKFIEAENAMKASKSVNGEVIGVYRKYDEGLWEVIYRKYH